MIFYAWKISITYQQSWGTINSHSGQKYYFKLRMLQHCSFEIPKSEFIQTSSFYVFYEATAVKFKIHCSHNRLWLDYLTGCSRLIWIGNVLFSLLVAPFLARQMVQQFQSRAKELTNSWKILSIPLPLSGRVAILSSAYLRFLQTRYLKKKKALKCSKLLQNKFQKTRVSDWAWCWLSLTGKQIFLWPRQNQLLKCSRRIWHLFTSEACER